jgi:hypothetical protein
MTEPANSDLTGRLPGAPSRLAGHRFEQRTRQRRAISRATAEPFFKPIPGWIWMTAGLLAFIGFFSANPWLTSFGIILLPVLGSLLWFKGEPPVMLLACVIQWMQATAAVFYCDEYNVSLLRASGIPEFNSATWLSLIGVLALALGMRTALFWRRSDVAERLDEESQFLRPGMIFVMYIVAFLAFYFLLKIAAVAPSVKQPLLALANIRWVLVFLLAYSVLQRGTHFLLLAAVFLFELVFGLLGFFSGFRGIFLMLLVVLPGTRFSLRGWRLAMAAILGVVLIGLSIVWMTIKSDYRSFLNQGSGEQEVTVPVSDRVNMIARLVGQINQDSIAMGMNELILRISYVNYFSLCMRNVPAEIPYQHGALWFGAIKHALMPRLLFPNKPSLDDSAETEIYTGLHVAGMEQGTSISIGYIGESYIDFGRVGMFVPIFLAGLFFGGIYRFFSRYRHAVIGLAVATSILLFGVYQIEMSCTKMVGGNVVILLVMGLFIWLFGTPLWRLITQPPRARPSRRHKRRLRPNA